MRSQMSLCAAAVVSAALFGSMLLTGCGGGSGGQVAANEVKIPSVMKAYAVAQTSYHREDFDKDQLMEYADKLPQLAKDLADFAKSNGAKSSLPEGLAAAYGQDGKPLHGYVFKECQTFGANQKIDWVNDYALCATPAKYGQTGRKTFIINTNGQVWAKDLGKSELISGCPMDPKSDGWEAVK
jgi:hypothetical protein